MILEKGKTYRITAKKNIQTIEVSKFWKLFYITKTKVKNKTIEITNDIVGEGESFPTDSVCNILDLYDMEIKQIGRVLIFGPNVKF